MASLLQPKTQCSGEITKDIDSCDCMQRISVALQYHNISKKDKFVKFFSTYKNLLNDWIHVLQTHSNELEHIHIQLIKHHNFTACNIKQCVSSKRRYEDKVKTKKK
eukprot:474406_1